MTTYLIDYENTHHNGLAGMDKLSESDYVVIFINKNVQTIPIDAVVKMTRPRAARPQIIWKFVTTPAKKVPNYLDMQLGTYLGCLVGKAQCCQFAIISKDNGFGAVCDFWKQQRPNILVLQATSISDAVKLLSDTSNKATNDIASVPAKPVSVTVENVNKPAPVVKSAVLLNEKIKPSIKKKVGEILKAFKLTGGNYVTVYSIFRERGTETAFCAAINTAFSKTMASGRHNELAMKLKPVYKEFLQAS